MPELSPEVKTSFRGDTLPQTTVRDTSEIVIPGYDGHPMTPEKQKAIDVAYASHEQSNFASIDQQTDKFIGVLGNNLSEVQASNTNPSVLVHQAERLIKAANAIIDSAIDDKVSIRQRNETNLHQDISTGAANADLEVLDGDRRKRIVEVLLANRAAREGMLENTISDMKEAARVQVEAVENYRSYLLDTDPAQLQAFDAHFARPIVTEPLVESPIVETEHTMTRTEELEAIRDSALVAEKVAEEKPRTAQTRLAMAGRVIFQVTIAKPFKAFKELVEVSDQATTLEKEEAMLQRVI